MSDLQNALENMVRVAQHVIPKSEYAVDEGLKAYTKAILCKHAKTNTKIKIKEYSKLTVQDIKYGFMKMYLAHVEDIQNKDLTWLLLPESSFLVIKNFDECLYPLTKVYVLASDDENKRLFEASFFSCISHSLAEKQIEQRNAIYNVLDHYKDIIPSGISQFLKDSEIDVTAILTKVERIMSIISSLSPPDFRNREDIISAVIETLQKVENDKTLNEDLKSLMELSTNEKVIRKVPDLVTGFIRSKTKND